MISEEHKVEFLKSRILKRLEELQSYMSSTKYRLYKTIIEDCTSFEEIRDMAELDLQFGLIKYAKDIEDKLEKTNTTLNEIESINNVNAKSIKFNIIKSNDKTFDINNINILSLEEDMEDEEVLASAANILLSRINAAPIEELYREEIENYEENELSEEYVDAIDTPDDEMFYDEDGEEETEDDFDLDIEEDEDFFNEDESDDEDDELEYDDIDEDELGIEEAKQDIKDIKPDFSNEADDEEDELDFGDNEVKDIEDIDASELYNNDIDEEEDDDETDWDSLGEDLYDDDESAEEDEETDWDSLGEDLYDDSDEDDSSEEDDETDWDSLGNDMFDEDIDEDDEESDDEDETDWDSLGDDIFENGIDDEDEEENEEDNIDDIEFEEDDSDVDDIDFDYEEPEGETDNFDDFFNVDVNDNKKKKRELTSDKIFMNGSKRGAQTQQMFNILNNIIGGVGKVPVRIINKR